MQQDMASSTLGSTTVDHNLADLIQHHAHSADLHL